MTCVEETRKMNLNELISVVDQGCGQYALCVDGVQVVGGANEGYVHAVAQQIAQALRKALGKDSATRQAEEAALVGAVLTAGYEVGVVPNPETFHAGEASGNRILAVVKALEEARDRALGDRYEYLKRADELEKRLRAERGEALEQLSVVRQELATVTLERDRARLCLERDAARLADEVQVLIRRRVIDARSPAADALLDFRNPPSTPRADRLVELELEVERLVRNLGEMTRLRHEMLAAMPDTYGDAVLAGLPVEDMPSHEWDNRTGPEKIVWMVETLATKPAALEHALAEQRAIADNLRGLCDESEQEVKQEVKQVRRQLCALQDAVRVVIGLYESTPHPDADTAHALVSRLRQALDPQGPRLAEVYKLVEKAWEMRHGHSCTPGAQDCPFCLLDRVRQGGCKDPKALAARIAEVIKAVEERRLDKARLCGGSGRHTGFAAPVLYRDQPLYTKCTLCGGPWEHPVPLRPTPLYVALLEAQRLATELAGGVGA